MLSFARRATLRSLGQLALLAIVAVAVPAGLCRVLDKPGNIIDDGAEASQFNPGTELKTMRKGKPSWVLIGNSMLNSRIDNRELTDTSGWKTRKVAKGGSQSALWFLFLKNIVIESGARPGLISVFFRDTDLTWPDFRVEGNNEGLNAELGGPDDPVWQQVLVKRRESTEGFPGRIRDALHNLFPDKDLRPNARRQMQDRALRFTRIGTKTRGSGRRIELNERFSLAHLRHDLGGDFASASGTQSARTVMVDGEAVDPTFYEDGPHTFDPSPTASFLPHIIALAKAHGSQLHFHRVKRRPLTNNTRPDDPVLKRYMTDLHAYLTANGCLFTDESQDARLTLDMYADGDHISANEAIQKRYLANFWERIGPVIKPLRQETTKPSN